jgi:xanthine/uracil permease
MKSLTIPSHLSAESASVLTHSPSSTIGIGFQHALAMLAGVVTPVLIMSGPGTGNMNLDVSTRSYMLSASLISSGILSLIQITRFRIFNTKYYLGTGLLSVLQCAWMEQKAERDFCLKPFPSPLPLPLPCSSLSYIPHYQHES